MGKGQDVLSLGGCVTQWQSSSLPDTTNAPSFRRTAWDREQDVVRPVRHESRDEPRRAKRPATRSNTERWIEIE
jgi:hypothetical protein